MKKKLCFIAAIVSIALFSACSKSSNGPGNPQEKVLYQTDFSNDDNYWITGTLNGAPGATASIQNGYYQVTNNRDVSKFIYNTRFFNGITDNNMAVEASIKVASISSNQQYYGEGGIVWDERESNNSNFYFNITDVDGAFTIWGYPNGVNSNYVVYKDYTQNKLVHIGQYNTLRIELRNNMLHFFINGTEVYSMTPVNDNSLNVTGLFINSRTIMQADYFKTAELQ